MRGAIHSLRHSLTRRKKAKKKSDILEFTIHEYSLFIHNNEYTLKDPLKLMFQLGECKRKVGVSFYCMVVLARLTADVSIKIRQSAECWVSCQG